MLAALSLPGILRFGNTNELALEMNECLCITNMESAFWVFFTYCHSFMQHDFPSGLRGGKPRSGRTLLLHGRPGQSRGRVNPAMRCEVA